MPRSDKALQNPTLTEFHLFLLGAAARKTQKLPRVITTSFSTTSLIGRSRASRGALPMARMHFLSFDHFAKHAVAVVEVQRRC